MRKWFKGISKAIFIYGLEQLAKTERERDAIKGEKVDIVVQWDLNLVATKIFGTVKHWPSTSMWGRLCGGAARGRMPHEWLQARGQGDAKPTVYRIGS